MATPLPAGWQDQLLGALGAPQTPENVSNLDWWQQQEGGSTANTASFNPFNTTRGTGLYGQPLGGSPIAGNSAGVLAFGSWDAGLEATAATIEQPNMNSILTALRQGNLSTDQFNSAIAQSQWLGTGGGGYGSSSPAVLTSSSSPSTQYFGGIPTTPPPAPHFGLNPISDLAQSASWLGEFGAWTIFTGIVFTLGAALTITGVVMLGAVLFGPVTGPALKAVGEGTIIGRAARVTKRVGRGSSGATRSGPAAPSQRDLDTAFEGGRQRGAADAGESERARFRSEGFPSDAPDFRPPTPTRTLRTPAQKAHEARVRSEASSRRRGSR